MISKLFQSSRLYLRQETGFDRWQRMWICALVGVLTVTIFAWTISTINLITLPGQHLGMDWHRLWFYWGGLSIIVGLEGLFVGWFTEHYEGIAFGWIPVELLTLGAYVVYIFLAKTNFTIALISIVGLVEATGVLIFLSVFLRLTANKLIQDYYSEDMAGRWKRILSFTAGIVIVIILIGSLARYDVSVVQSLRSFNNLMDRVAIDTSLETRLPLDTIPELRSHLGKPYEIYPRPDTDTVGVYIFAVIFPDGFSFSCRVSIGQSQQNYYFTDCSQGAMLSFP